jgi:energy-coupling factor transporter ATP-binding protein EcfA2
MGCEPLPVHHQPGTGDAERIWIVGPPGSGKSTLARCLARRLEVPATHLDDLHWLPGWVERPAAETAARIASVVERSRWVIDGNYATFRDLHRDRVQLFVWLDLPLRTTFPRLLERGVLRSMRRESCCNGNYESLRLTFLDRESLLLYALATHTKRHRELAAKLAGRPHVRFRDPRQVRRWLATGGPHPASSNLRP